MNSTEMKMSLEFVDGDSFKGKYYRNNRGGCGQKNIRCFPTCANPHAEKYFCGKPLTVVLEILTEPDSRFVSCSQVMEEIRLVAQFQVFAPVNGIAEPVSGRVLKSLIKTKANPTNPYFYGKIVETKVSLKTDKGTLHRCVVNFNSECKGWHYAWVGNRFRSNIPHVVSVSVMRVDRELSFGKDCPAVSTSELMKLFGIESIVFRPVANFNSPSFCVESCARRRNKSKGGNEGVGKEQDESDEEKEVDDDVPLSNLVNKTPTAKQQSLREVEQESIREIQRDTLLGANANEERANSAAAKVVTMVGSPTPDATESSCRENNSGDTPMSSLCRIAADRSKNATVERLKTMNISHALLQSHMIARYNPLSLASPGAEMGASPSHEEDCTQSTTSPTIASTASITTLTPANHLSAGETTDDNSLADCHLEAGAKRAKREESVAPKPAQQTLIPQVLTNAPDSPMSNLGQFWSQLKDDSARSVRPSGDLAPLKSKQLERQALQTQLADPSFQHQLYLGMVSHSQTISADLQSSLEVAHQKRQCSDRQSWCVPQNLNSDDTARIKAVQSPDGVAACTSMWPPDCPEHSAIEAALSYLSEVRAREAAVEKQTELLMQILSAPCAALDLLADITTCWKPPGVGARSGGSATTGSVGTGAEVTVVDGSANAPPTTGLSVRPARAVCFTCKPNSFGGDYFYHADSDSSDSGDSGEDTSALVSNSQLRVQVGWAPAPHPNSDLKSNNKRKAVDVDELLFSETDNFYAANYKRASSMNNSSSSNSSSNKAQDGDTPSGEKRQHKCPRCGAPKRGHRCSKVLPQTVRNKSLRFIGASSELFAPADSSK